jgi:hypothetical protein
VENGFIESFNGRLRDEFLNVERFVSLEDARQKLAKFCEYYNQHVRTARKQTVRQRHSQSCTGWARKRLVHCWRALQSLLIESLEIR